MTPDGTTPGTVVVITGGTRGLGLGLARAFLDRGCRVALCGRDRASLDDALTHLQAPDGELIGVTTDVTDRARTQALWDRAHAHFGRVDTWINNAGATTGRKPLWELPSREIESVVGANLLGVVHGSAVALGGFRDQGHGALWNMEGFGSDGRILPGLTTYGATKRAVTYLTDALAKEIAADRSTERSAHRITVAHLSPGMVVTDLLTHGYTDEEFAGARKILTILADRVETVAPWLADRVLAGTANGARVAWLTRRKAFARFLLAPVRHRDPFVTAAPEARGVGGRA